MFIFPRSVFVKVAFFLGEGVYQEFLVELKIHTMTPMILVSLCLMKDAQIFSPEEPYIRGPYREKILGGGRDSDDSSIQQL